MYESGVRSPLAPTEPSSGMHGSTRAVSSAHRRSSVSILTAEYPREIDASRTATIAAASVSPKIRPVPQPW